MVKQLIASGRTVYLQYLYRLVLCLPLSLFVVPCVTIYIIPLRQIIILRAIGIFIETELAFF